MLCIEGDKENVEMSFHVLISRSSNSLLSKMLHIECTQETEYRMHAKLTARRARRATLKHTLIYIEQGPQSRCTLVTNI